MIMESCGCTPSREDTADIDRQKIDGENELAALALVLVLVFVFVFVGGGRRLASRQWRHVLNYCLWSGIMLLGS